MKNKLDNILLSILWLSASTLVACFWFNIKFGFNIFSNAHWRHLAYMQANQTPVNTTFYLSIIVSILITIVGLYVLLRPHFRKIILPIRDTHTPSPEHTKKPIPRATHQPAPHTTNQSPTPVPHQKLPETGISRPPHLNLSTPLLNQTETVAPIAPPAPTTPTVRNVSETHQTNNWPEIGKIFEQAGYTLKKTPKISGLQTSLFAIGTDENLWIGAVGVETSALQAAIDSVQQIFSDTLDDIEINVHGFIISARDASAPTAPDILIFDSTDSLRNYMQEHQNTPPSTDDMENFEAFSSYISTVVEYLGKM